MQNIMRTETGKYEHENSFCFYFYSTTTHHHLLTTLQNRKNTNSTEIRPTVREAATLQNQL